MKEIEKILDLTEEIMKISYPLCKNKDENIAISAANINNKANDIIKYIDSLEARLKLNGIDEN